MNRVDIKKKQSIAVLPGLTGVRERNITDTQRFIGFSVVAIALVCILCHALTFATYFQHDDFIWLSVAKQWKQGEKTLFAPNLWNTFRPGTHVLFYLAYRAFGDWAPGFHAFSLMMHILVTLTIFALISRLCHDVSAGLFGALVFATGSGHLEAVQWVSAIGYPVVALLAIFAVLSADRYVSYGKRRDLIQCYVLPLSALFVHETAVILPFYMVLYSCLFATKKVMIRRLTLVLSQLSVMICWFACYYKYYSALGQRIAEKGEPSLLSPAHMFGNMLRSIPTFVMPDIHLPSIQHRLPEIMPWAVTPIESIWMLISILLPVAGLYMMIRGTPQMRLGVLWCLSGVALGSLSSAGFAGRYLYLPAVGFAITIGAVWSHTTLISNIGKLRSLVLVLVFTVILTNLASSAICYAYLVKNGKERQQLLAHIKHLHSLDDGQKRTIQLVGFPYKYYDLQIAARYYGIDAKVTECESALSHLPVIHFGDIR